jgi:hypothetical protein
LIEFFFEIDATKIPRKTIWKKSEEYTDVPFELLNPMGK